MIGFCQVFVCSPPLSKVGCYIEENNMKKLIEKIMDKILLPNRHFQDYITWHNLSKNYIIVPVDKGLFYRDGVFFGIHDMLVHTLIAYEDYKLDDIQEKDIILDIGACTGGFSLQAAKKAKHVFSVEPLYSEELKKNIELNKFENVTVIEAALGAPGKRKLEYGYSYNRTSKNVQFITFQDIMKSCERVDFLKCDCEGGEWSITANDLKGIRRIEAEVHEDEYHKLKDFLNVLDTAGFVYTCNSNIVHAVKQPKVESLSEQPKT